LTLIFRTDIPSSQYRGKQKAIVALAHKVLVILYHVLRDKKPYSDLGTDYFDKLDLARIQRQAVRRLEQLGYAVTLTPKEQGAA
jgi:transposase